MNKTTCRSVGYLSATEQASGSGESHEPSQAATSSINAMLNTDTAGPRFDVTLKDSVQSQQLATAKILPK